MVLRSVRRRENCFMATYTSGCCMTLKEKVLVEEKNLQDYQKRREEEKVRNGKVHMENLLPKLQVWLERSPVDVSEMVC